MSAALRPLITLAAVLGAALWVAPSAAAVPSSGLTGQERVTRYDIGMELRPDGSMRVTERIDYDFAGQTDKRGIFRTISNVFALENDPDRERVYPVDDVTVSSPTGAPTGVKRDSESGQEILRIGDEDRYLDGTPETYEIGYDVEGVVNAVGGQQELYWNAVGTAWDVPLERVTVTVTGPAAVQRTACFRGPERSAQTCENTIADGAARFTEPSLAAGEGMSVVAAFPAGTFTGGPVVRERQTLQRAFSLDPATAGTGLGVLALLGGGAVLLATRRGRDEHYLGVTPGLEPGLGQQATTARMPFAGRPPVAVQFTPPAGMRPGQLGTLVDEQAHVVDVTATIVDLAVRGYLRIEEVSEEGRFRSGDWRLVMADQPPAEPLHDYEQALFNAIFAGRQEVLLSDLKETFRADLQKVQGMLYDDVTRSGWFRGNPKAVRLRWQVIGVLVVLAGAGLTWLLATRTRFGLVGLAVVVAGVVVLVAAPRMPARTARGTALLAQAKGFRMYLETAEADQIRFEEGEDVFSRYLPFAIVFGVAERWAKVFARLAATGAAVAVPTWYVGSGYLHGGFDYDGFGRSMEGFATSTSGAIAAATPSSSGSSGFGGGGFSGGGGGGGGGGSW